MKSKVHKHHTTDYFKMRNKYKHCKRNKTVRIMLKVQDKEDHQEKCSY